MQMSIREQIEDVKFLVEHRRYVGALTVLTLAVAASSKKIFPNGTMSIRNPKDKMRDEEAFTLFLGDRLHRILLGSLGQQMFANSGQLIPFKDKKFDLAYILYKYYRCALVHDGELPEDVEFADPPADQSHGINFSNGGYSVGFNCGEKLVLDYGWINVLIEAVEGARCNAEEFEREVFDLNVPAGANEADFSREIIERHGASLGRYELLKEAVRYITPAKITRSADGELKELFQCLVEREQISQGAITGLSSRGFTSRAGDLQDKGIAMIRDIAAAFLAK
jgi:hypothetical protein